MRHTPIETDDILYRLLTANQAVNAAVNGRIYPQGERPDNSTTADIVVNTIALDTDMPQTGTSNVNIHVPDEKGNINGQQQYHIARETMRSLTALVVSAIEQTTIPGLSLRISNQNIIAEESVHQHYMNIRVEWNIQREVETVPGTAGSGVDTGQQENEQE